MDRGLTWLALTAVMSLATACDGVGTTCDVSGSTEGCGSGLICTLTRSLEFDLTTLPVNVCLEECDTSRDCGDGEVCRLVPCVPAEEDVRSCQTTPTFEPEEEAQLCAPDDSDGSDDGSDESES